jgi:phage head maturation protease
VDDARGGIRKVTRIAGYAVTFGVKQIPLAGSPRRLVARAAAFNSIPASAPLCLLHNRDVEYATANLWVDRTGIAFSAELPNDNTGWGLAHAIARGGCDEVSPLLTNISTSVETVDGESCDILVACGIGEVSIVANGSCPGAVAWIAEADREDLLPRARVMRAKWQVGRQQHILAMAHAARPAPRRRVSAHALQGIDRIMNSDGWNRGRQQLHRFLGVRPSASAGRRP